MAKQEIKIILNVDEMVYEIHNKTYLTGRSLENNTDQAIIAHMETNDDDGEINQILRSLSDSFAKFLTRMSEYIEDESDSADNILPSRGSNYEITLYMPSNYNTAANADIARAAAQFLVNTALYDWFAMTYPKAAEDYGKRAEACIAEINLAAHRRKRPTRDVNAISTAHAIDGVKITNSTTSDDIGLLKDTDISAEDSTIIVNN